MRRPLGMILVLAAIVGAAVLVFTGTNDPTGGDPSLNSPTASATDSSLPPDHDQAPTSPGPSIAPPTAEEKPGDGSAGADHGEEAGEGPAEGDIPQDRHPDATNTPSAFVPRDQVSDAELQRALEHQYSDPQPEPPYDREAIEMAWQHQRQDIASSMVWTQPRKRAAVALLVGPNADPSNPVAVTVTITWSAHDRAGESVLKRSSIDLTRSVSSGRWTIHD